MRRYRILKTEIIEDGHGVAIQFETKGEIHNLFWQCGYDGKGGLFRIRDNDFNACDYWFWLDDSENRCPDSFLPNADEYERYSLINDIAACAIPAIGSSADDVWAR